MTLRCALDFVPNGKIMLRKCDAVQWFSWLRMAEPSQDQKEAVWRIKGWKGRKWIAGESLKETKNLKLMLNVTFFDEKLFILIARKVIAMLWLFVVYCFVFGVFLSRRLRIALVNVSKCVVEASWYKGNLWPGIRPSRKINRFENVDKTKLRLPNYCPELDIQNFVCLWLFCAE